LPKAVEKIFFRKSWTAEYLPFIRRADLRSDSSESLLAPVSVRFMRQELYIIAQGIPVSGNYSG
jgi:hypothetical protein